MFRSGPPLTAIDRFLWGQQSQFPQKQPCPLNVAKNNITHASVFDEGFYRFACSGGSSSFWPNTTTTQEGNFYDEFLANEEALNWAHQFPTLCQKEDADGLGKNLKERPNKKGSSVSLIKGQWTGEEDRKLLKLVKQHGVTKWSQIAEKLEGRAGKQCRERWHNHLRPDIKKDGWSEEEERILVETHAEVGNRWAEIAKRIPGRTENAIKNHWNATKRKQNSKRKNKRPASSNGKPPPTILQDYIKHKTLNSTKATITIPFNSTTEISVTLDNNNNSSTTLLIDDSRDDELLFMQELFKENMHTQQQEVSNVVEGVNHFNNSSNSYNNFSLGYSQTNDGNQFLTDVTEGRFVHSNPNPNPNNNNMFFDLYLSNLLNGAASSSSSLCCDYGNQNLNTDLKLGDDVQDCSNGKREMDLIEMVCSKNFSTSSF
ncbi:hypothetical protein RIF29_13290 [Crotalaria pallida]|uniref:Uncharacterized protein n=1 Tax=Crotalaria pallida TaxID=3830 RepID=A0AAN9P2X4_CROPI